MPPSPLARSPAPDFAATSAYPQLIPARDAVAAKDWPAARAEFAGMDQHLLWHAIGESADIDGCEIFFQDVLASDPTQTLAGTALGARLVVKGWGIRTTARASYVSQQQFQAFHEHLREAEQVLIDVTARDPACLVAWTWRITSARGLQLGQAEARRRYDRVARHDPHYLPAQTSLLQQLCPKWSGSFEAMHAFARDCAAAAPDGAHSVALVADAHIEHALELEDPQRWAYWGSETTRTEIRRAAGRCVLHPDFQRTPGWVAVANTFAMALSMIDDHAGAAACFGALGPLATENPWSYFGDPAALIVANRNRAMRKTGRS